MQLDKWRDLADIRTNVRQTNWLGDGGRGERERKRTARDGERERERSNMQIFEYILKVFGKTEMRWELFTKPKNSANYAVLVVLNPGFAIRSAIVYSHGNKKEFLCFLCYCFRSWENFISKNPFLCSVNVFFTISHLHGEEVGYFCKSCTDDNLCVFCAVFFLFDNSPICSGFLVGCFWLLDMYWTWGGNQWDVWKGRHCDGVYWGDCVTWPRGQGSRQGLLFSKPRELIAHVTHDVHVLLWKLNFALGTKDRLTDYGENQTG